MISQAAFDGQIENKKHQDMWMKYVMQTSIKRLLLLKGNWVQGKLSFKCIAL